MFVITVFLHNLMSDFIPMPSVTSVWNLFVCFPNVIEIFFLFVPICHSKWFNFITPIWLQVPSIFFSRVNTCSLFVHLLCYIFRNNNVDLSKINTQSNSIITNSVGILMFVLYYREAFCSELIIWDKIILQIVFVIAVNSLSLQPSSAVITSRNVTKFRHLYIAMSLSITFQQNFNSHSSISTQEWHKNNHNEYVSIVTYLPEKVCYYAICIVIDLIKRQNVCM
jgi:hypothetical protein